MDDNTRIHRPRNLTDNYTIVSNAIINDRRLSYKARGILLYLLSKPPDWKCLISDLATLHDKRTAVLSGLKELRTIGYMSYIVERIKGKITRCYYVVYPSPEENNRRDQDEERKSRKDKGSSPLCGNLFAAVEEQADQHFQANSPEHCFPLVENLKAGKPQAENLALQSTDFTKYESKKTTTGLKSPAAAAPKPEPPAADVVVLLGKRGIKGRVASDLAANYNRGRIERAIEHLDTEMLKGDIENPTGWLVSCLKGDWQPPPPSAEASKARRQDEERRGRLNLSSEGRDFMAKVEACIATVDTDTLRGLTMEIVREAPPELRSHLLANPTRTNWLLAEKVYARLTKPRSE